MMAKNKELNRKQKNKRLMSHDDREKIKVKCKYVLIVSSIVDEDFSKL